MAGSIKLDIFITYVHKHRFYGRFNHVEHFHHIYAQAQVGQMLPLSPGPKCKPYGSLKKKNG
jgi:hypothetical protein